MLIGNENWRGRLIRFAPLFLWISVIFLLSSNMGSTSHTSIFVRPILNFLFPNSPEETLQLYHSYVRKAAHFTEYAVLAYLAIWAFCRFPDRLLRAVVYSLLIVVSVAVIDEYNQSFNLSRTGSWYDVLIDISGGAAMMATICIWNLLRRGHRLISSRHSKDLTEKTSINRNFV